MIDLESRMKHDDVIFHMEARNGWINTYGASTAPITTSNVHQEKCSGFLDNKDRDCFRADEDYAIGTINITDNLFGGASSTNQYSISFWMFISDIKKTTSFYPFTCGAMNHFYISDGIFYYRTSHYYCGVTYKNILPNNRWCHILVTVDATHHGNTKVRLYVDGKIVSLGYTESSFDPGAGTGITGYNVDFVQITSTTADNKWELIGNPGGGLYLLREFTIYKTCLVNDENFIPPHKWTAGICGLTLINRQFMGFFNIGSVDPVKLADGSSTHGVTHYDGSYKESTPHGILYFKEIETQYRNSWSDSFNSSYEGVVTLWVIWKYVKHITKDQSEDLEDPNGTTYLSRRDHSVHRYESQDGIKNFSGQLILTFNGRIVQQSKRYNQVESYSEFYDKISIYVKKGTNTITCTSIDNMPFNYQKYQIIHREDDIVGGKLRKGEQWDIYSRLVVPEYAMHVDISPCRIDVDNTNKSAPPGTTPGMKRVWRVTLEIPFPYPQFTEMQWILVAPNGRFVPEIFYDRIDDHHIRFKNGNPFDAGAEEDFKFTFLHKHGFYAVNKFEQSLYATTGVLDYQFNSPYDGLVDLQKRVKVFINCEFLNPNLELYSFDNSTGSVRFSENFSFSPSDLITFLCFYTGTKMNDHTISRLPMSGYIEFRPMHIDRVYDKDLFAVFMNGKLVSRDDITDMTSNIHKINRDIKTRYNLEVMNMSPLISYMTPYLLAEHKKVQDKKTVWEFPCKLNIPYPGVYHQRYYVDPDIFNPVEWKHLVPSNLGWYISLIHHGLNKAEKDYQKELTYTLKFFRDEYERDPEPVYVMGQIRLKGNEEQFYPDHPSNTLIGILPSVMKNTSKDQCLMTIQAQTIWDNDKEFNESVYGQSIDGIMCRLEINDQKIDHWHRLYYELVCNNYERDVEIEILEWRISAEACGEGEIFYQKTIPFLPFETPDFPELD